MISEVKEKIRTVTFLSRKQIDFLDKLGKDALFSQGLKLSRSQILSSLVDLLVEIGMDVKKLNLHQDNLANGLLKIIHEEKEDEQKTLL